MGRSWVMNVCMSRWGGEGINQFPGSEEKLAAFASLRPAGKTEAWFNFFKRKFKENPLQMAEISQKTHKQLKPQTSKSCSRRRKNTTFSKHRQVNMNKKCPSCIINYYFRKKTDSFSLNSNIQIFPLAEHKKGARLQVDHCTLGFSYHYLLIYPLFTTQTFWLYYVYRKYETTSLGFFIVFFSCFYNKFCERKNSPFIFPIYMCTLDKDTARRNQVVARNVIALSKWGK